MINEGKIMILGAGHVGSHCALALAGGEVCPEIVLVDIDREKEAPLDLAVSEKVPRITRETVAEHGPTTLMITHNMRGALSCGNRTLLMDGGRPVLGIRGKQREGMPPRALTGMFMDATHRMPTDRSMLTS